MNKIHQKRSIMANFDGFSKKSIKIMNLSIALKISNKRKKSMNFIMAMLCYFQKGVKNKMICGP